MPLTRRLGSRLRSAAGFVVTLAVIAGCDGVGSVDSPAPPPPPTPAERFERFLTTLKRKVQDPSLRASSAAADYGAEPGTPVTDWATTIEHDYQPSTGDQPPRAAVTLVTKSTVTMVLPKRESESDSDGKGRSRDSGKSDGAGELGAIVSPAPSPSRLPASSIQTLPNEQKTRLELEYRGDAWVLLTELDRIDQPFTAAAVEYALRRQ